MCMQDNLLCCTQTGSVRAVVTFAVPVSYGLTSIVTWGLYTLGLMSLSDVLI